MLISLKSRLWFLQKKSSLDILIKMDRLRSILIKFDKFMLILSQIVNKKQIWNNLQIRSDLENFFPGIDYDFALKLFYLDGL